METIKCHCIFRPCSRLYEYLVAWLLSMSMCLISVPKYMNVNVMLYSRLCHDCSKIDETCRKLMSQTKTLPEPFASIHKGIAKPFCDKTNTGLCAAGPVVCCTGWSKVMSICTRKCS